MSAVRDAGQQPAAPMAAVRRRYAQAAAHRAVSAADELLRYATEGPNWPEPFGTEEPVELLADALKMALELARDHAADGGRDPREYDHARARLLGEVSRYLEDWAG